MNTRRNFLKQIALAGLSTSVLPSSLFAAEKDDSLRWRPTFSSDSLNLNSPGSSDADFWIKVRAQFPLSHDLIYLNNGTLGPSPSPVLNTVIREMQALEFDHLMHLEESPEPREKLAEFLGANADEISLTHNTTEGINVVAWGLPLHRGDEVIMTTHEHAGNAIPWLNRARLEGIVIRTFTPGSTAAENLEKINSLITSRTRSFAIPHLSCTTGQVFPVKEISALGRSKNIFVMIDGAHGTGQMALNLHDIGCDFYASCGHKWLCGPKGTGYLYVRKEMQSVLQAKFSGADAADYDLSTTPPRFVANVNDAHRYDYGTKNQALSTGLSAAVDFFNHVGFEKILARGRFLTQTLRDELHSRSSHLQVITPEEKESRAMITGFRFTTKNSADFGPYCTDRHVRIRHVGEAHLNSIRISTHLYTSENDLKRLLTCVDEFVSRG
jgi:selenocysteine lyase/cysteine desulfurase